MKGAYSFIYLKSDKPLMKMIFSLITFFVLQPISAKEFLVRNSNLPLQESSDCGLKRKLTRFASEMSLFRSKTPFPIRVNKNFNIRVIGNSVSSSQRSPRKVLKETKKMLKMYIDELEELGLTQDTFYQVLVESELNAVKQLGITKSGALSWAGNPGSFPWIHNATELIGMPALSGQIKLFTGKLKANRLGNKPKVFFLPMINEKSHSLDFKFIIAHEIAHTTEPDSTTWPMLWREARADYLAYFLTGETKMRVPPGTEVEVMDKAGVITRKKVDSVRDIASPEVKKLSEVRPSMQFFHDNSTLFSSMLLDMEKEFGKEASLDLIRWMDLHDKSYFLNKPVHSQKENLSVVRKAIYKDFNVTSNAIRDWIKQYKKIPDGQKKIILNFLSHRGLF